MTEVVHADIFFVITAVAVVLISLALLVVLYFVIHILPDIRAVTAKVRKASDELERDFERLRSEVKNEGLKVKTVFDIVLGFVHRQVERPRARRKKVGEAHDIRN